MTGTLIWRECICGAWYWGAAQTEADKAHAAIGTYAELLRERDAIQEDYNALSDEHDKCERSPYESLDEHTRQAASGAHLFDDNCYFCRAESADQDVRAVAQEYFEASLPLLNGYPLTDSERRYAWERLRETNAALRAVLGIKSRGDDSEAARRG